MTTSFYDEDQPAKKKTHPLVLLLAIILVPAGLVRYANLMSGSEEYGDASAYVAGQNFVKKSLKNPGGAVFDELNSGDGFHFERADGLFEVGGTVRSTNSFGGIVPARWKCVVRSNGGGSFSLVYLKLGDDESGQYPKDAMPRDH